MSYRKRRKGISETLNSKIFLGEDASRPPSLERLLRSNFTFLAYTFKIPRFVSGKFPRNGNFLLIVRLSLTSLFFSFFFSKTSFNLLQCWPENHKTDSKLYLNGNWATEPDNEQICRSVLFSGKKQIARNWLWPLYRHCFK